jgi:hypothetical protein
MARRIGIRNQLVDALLLEKLAPRDTLNAVTSDKCRVASWNSSPDTRHLSKCRYLRRGATPGPFFFTLGLREPRGSVRFGLGAAFLRAARFSFLRSSLSVIFFGVHNLADSRQLIAHS